MNIKNRSTSYWLSSALIASSLSALTLAPVQAIAEPVCDATNCTLTFDYTGSSVDWIVPVGVTSLSVTIAGAAGGNTDGATGGLGGRVTADIAVLPGEPLRIYAGAQGSTPAQDIDVVPTSQFLSGGKGAYDTSTAIGNGASGGSGSEIRTAPYYPSSRLLVAGGGGGAAAFCGNGGNGGLAATSGTSCGTGIPGSAATATAQGAAYINRGSTYGNVAGVGGNAGLQPSPGSGGGGGGRYGGGAGSAITNGQIGAGGGGGTSWAHATRATSVSYADASNSGNGQVVISYLLPAVTPEPTPTVEPIPSATATPEATIAPSPTPTPVITQTPEATPTPEVTSTPEPTPTPEVTSAPTSTPAPVPSPEETSVPSPTTTSEPAPEATPTPMPTPEVSAAPEPTPEPVAIPSPALRSGSSLEIAPGLTVMVNAANQISATMATPYTGKLSVELIGQQKFLVPATSVECVKYKKVSGKKKCVATRSFTRTAVSDTCKLTKALTAKSKSTRQVFRLSSSCRLITSVSVALGGTTNQMQLKLQFVRTYADTGLAYRLAGKTKRNTLSVVKATYMVPLAR